MAVKPALNYVLTNKKQTFSYLSLSKNIILAAFATFPYTRSYFHSLIKHAVYRYTTHICNNTGILTYISFGVIGGQSSA